MLDILAWAALVFCVPFGDPFLPEIVVDVGAAFVHLGKIGSNLVGIDRFSSVDRDIFYIGSGDLNNWVSLADRIAYHDADRMNHATVGNRYHMVKLQHLDCRDGSANANLIYWNICYYYKYLLCF